MFDKLKRVLGVTDEEDDYYEDEDMELTGRFIAAFSFKGERHKVDSWKDMIVTLCQLIYKDSPSSVRVLCNARFWLHDNPGPDNSRTQFAEGCYVHSSCSTKTKMSEIRYIFNKLNIAPSELEFELIPLVDSTNVDQTESGND